MTIGDFIARYIETPPQQEAVHTVSSNCSTVSQTGSGDRKLDGGEVAVKKGGDEDGRCPLQSSTSETSAGRKGVDDGARDTAYLAQHQLFDQIPALRRDVMTPDYCALLLGDEEDQAGAASVIMNAWFGPEGTVSPLHNDPFHNLLAQVVGKKRVLMVDHTLSNSVYPRPGLMTNTSAVDAANPDLDEHPLFKNAMPLVECELRKGEMLYIPPLFWHHITSLEVSFSVSFWWGKRRTL